MTKAFDKVDWDFLLAIMRKWGLMINGAKKINQYITTTNMVVVVNEAPRKFLKPCRGIGQGDPLHPYLFLFYMEALSRNISHDENLGLITGISICKDVCPFYISSCFC